jgi:5'-deoxynucleotidase YfbR-like HD superfamily hydrolase
MSTWKMEKEVLDPRRAGCLVRYHTWPCIRKQSVAEHSWNVARILLAIWPHAPRHMIVHALMHDVGEVAVGDMPYPIKARDPELKAKIDAAEDSAYLAMSIPWGLQPPARLSPEEQAVFKLADLGEMLEWSYDEVLLGNQFANLVVERCEKQIYEWIDQMIPEIKDAATIYFRRRKAMCDLVARKEGARTWI